MMQRLPADFSAAARAADDNAKLHLVSQNPQQLQGRVGAHSRSAALVVGFAALTTLLALAFTAVAALAVVGPVAPAPGAWASTLAQWGPLQDLSAWAQTGQGRLALALIWLALVADTVLVWRFARRALRRSVGAVGAGVRNATLPPQVGTIRDIAMRRYRKTFFAVLLVDLPSGQVIVNHMGKARDIRVPAPGTTVWAWQNGAATLIQAQAPATALAPATIPPLFAES
ncbi:hypothetical protein ABYF32_00285 [Buchananella felis]|uniref:hypothetical protein n=1 Tax=Buchananella felis TaxID=3231492 RepID=UPI00352877D8